MYLVYDNRSRISVRVEQLKTGKRHAQQPHSNLGRILSNIEILNDDGYELRVAANTLIFASNQRENTIWAARNEYVLRRADKGFFIVRKKVVLVNNDKALYTMAFLV